MLPLQTERLTIRLMRQGDTATLVAQRNYPAIGRFQDWELPFTEAAARHRRAIPPWWLINGGHLLRTSLEICSRVRHEVLTDRSS